MRGRSSPRTRTTRAFWPCRPSAQADVYSSEIRVTKPHALAFEPDATVQDLGEILGVVEGWRAEA